MSMKKRKEYMICPIHKVIEVSEYEMAAIDHKLTQKLRHVLQNDVLQYVFTSATHTRLSHSIGTMHVAGEVVKKMFERKSSEYLDITGEYLNSEQLKSIDYISSIIRLAALFHDLGHGAFSHQLEKTCCLNYIFESESTFVKLWGDIDTSNFYSENKKSIEHEHYSVRSAYEILTDIEIDKYAINIDDVLNTLDTTLGNPSEQFIEATSNLWNVITARSIGTPGVRDISKTEKGEKMMKVLKALISGEVDVDKMDYLLRDSYFCGVDYGKFNLENLIYNLNFCYSHENNWLGLTINEKAVGILENLITSRFDMFNQVYNHKTSNGFELLLNLSINEVMSIEKNKSDIEECFFNIRKFVKLTDDFLWQKFKEYAENNTESYCEKLISRKRLRYLGNFELNCDFSPDVKLEEIKIEANCNAMYRVIKTKFSKINKEYEDIMVLKKNPLSKQEEVERIHSFSSVFSENKDTETAFYHEV